MRVVNWSWKEADKMVGRASYKRVLKAAHVIKRAVKARCPTGTISRPMYKTGPYAGQPYTARDAGQLKRSVRVVERNENKGGLQLVQLKTFGPNFGLVRVYVGHFLAYYARIVEHYTPFMRPAADSVRGQVKNILENG